MARGGLLTVWLLVAACGEEPPPTEPAPATLVETRPATALGLDALLVNGRIQPRGRPTAYWFELGESEAYGRATAVFEHRPRGSVRWWRARRHHAVGWRFCSSSIRSQRPSSAQGCGAGVRRCLAHRSNDA